MNKKMQNFCSGNVEKQVSNEKNVLLSVFSNLIVNDRMNSDKHYWLNKNQLGFSIIFWYFCETLN